MKLEVLSLRCTLLGLCLYVLLLNLLFLAAHHIMHQTELFQGNFQQISASHDPRGHSHCSVAPAATTECVREYTPCHACMHHCIVHMLFATYLRNTLIATSLRSSWTESDWFFDDVCILLVEHGMFHIVLAAETNEERCDRLQTRNPTHQ